MIESWDCANCAGVEMGRTTECTRCGERRTSPGTGRPKFDVRAREVALASGGLLKLYGTQDEKAAYVAWCPAGAFALDREGTLVWVEDWGYLASVTVQGTELRLDGVPTDMRTGKRRAEES